MAWMIGMDLGGTNIKSGLVDLKNGITEGFNSIPTRAQDGRGKVMERLISQIQSLREKAEGMDCTLRGVGLCLPGRLNLKQGVVEFLTNFPGQWRDFPIVHQLQSQVGLPVGILNDVRAITYGEFRYGAGKGCQRLACLAIGTGVGGGLVLDGELLLGFSGTAGEIGHQTINAAGPLCGCGNRGCLETYASGPAIASRAARAVRQGLSTSIGQLVNYDLNLITPEIVSRAASAGDPVACEIWDFVGEQIGISLANICVVFGPERIILAGGVAAAGELLIRPIQNTLKQRVKVMPIDQTRLLTGQLGSQAGVLGAASWAAASTIPGIQPG